MKLEKIDFETYKKAIDLFVKIAYPNGVKEKNFCYKTIKALNESKNLDEMLGLFEEQTVSINEGKPKRKFIVRLGSEKYPFMKLVLQETVIQGDYGFLVDRHTEYLALVSSSKSFEEEKKIKEYSRKIKYKIEDAFDKSKIPTYREIVRETTKQLITMRNSATIQKNGIKVLVVEDDKDILFLNKVNLEILGYTVSSALNGDKAIYKIEHEFNDILILDLMMPKLSGFEIISRVADEIPIIVVTSLSDNMTKEKCLNNGAKYVLTKPVDIEILNSYIKKVLNK